MHFRFYNIEIKADAVVRRIIAAQHGHGLKLLIQLEKSLVNKAGDSIVIYIFTSEGIDRLIRSIAECELVVGPRCHSADYGNAFGKKLILSLLLFNNLAAAKAACKNAYSKQHGSEKRY